MDGRFEINYNEDVGMLAMNDHIEEAVIVLTDDEIEALIKWYCEYYGRMIV